MKSCSPDRNRVFLALLSQCPHAARLNCPLRNDRSPGSHKACLQKVLFLGSTPFLLCPHLLRPHVRVTMRTALMRTVHLALADYPDEGGTTIVRLACQVISM
jgi:hypothetical protein